MDHPVAVALEVIAISVALFRMPPSARVFRARGVGCEHGTSVNEKAQPKPRLLDRDPEAYCCRCCANLTRALSSFFVTFAKSSWSTSVATDLFHSSMARAQWSAASFRRPVFW